MNREEMKAELNRVESILDRLIADMADDENAVDGLEDELESAKSAVAEALDLLGENA